MGGRPDVGTGHHNMAQTVSIGERTLLRIYGGNGAEIRPIPKVCVRETLTSAFARGLAIRTSPRAVKDGSKAANWHRAPSVVPLNDATIGDLLAPLLTNTSARPSVNAGADGRISGMGPHPNR